MNILSSEARFFFEDLKRNLGPESVFIFPGDLQKFKKALTEQKVPSVDQRDADPMSLLAGFPVVEYDGRVFIGPARAIEELLDTLDSLRQYAGLERLRPCKQEASNVGTTQA